MRGWRMLVSDLCGWTAAFFVAAMMLITVADIVLRATVSVPIRGILELVELLLACSFFLALPATFLRDEHIVVDMIDAMLPLRVPLLKRIAAVFAMVVLLVMAWQGWIVAGDTLEFGDVTSDLSIPRIVYWIPVLAGIIGAALAALAVAAVGYTDRPGVGAADGRGVGAADAPGLGAPDQRQIAGEDKPGKDSP